MSEHPESWKSRQPDTVTCLVIYLINDVISKLATLRKYSPFIYLLNETFLGKMVMWIVMVVWYQIWSEYFAKDPIMSVFCSLYLKPRCYVTCTVGEQARAPSPPPKKIRDFLQLRTAHMHLLTHANTWSLYYTNVGNNDGIITTTPYTTKLPQRPPTPPYDEYQCTPPPIKCKLRLRTCIKCSEWFQWVK